MQQHQPYPQPQGQGQQDRLLPNQGPGPGAPQQPPGLQGRSPSRFYGPFPQQQQQQQHSYRQHQQQWQQGGSPGAPQQQWQQGGPLGAPQHGSGGAYPLPQHQQQHYQHPQSGGQVPPGPPPRSSGGGPQSGQGPSGPSSGQVQGATSGPGSGTAQPSGPMLFVTLELGKDGLLLVRMGHDEVVKQALKRVLGGAWDANLRCWTFPMVTHDRVVECLQGLKNVRINLTQLDPLPVKVLAAANQNPDNSNRYCHIPRSLEEQLMPFQREGVRFALRHGGRALIGDEMGLGKTVQALAVASAYRDEWPALIICPASLREQWADSLHRWLGVTEDKIHVVHTNKDAAAVPDRAQFLVVSYNFVPKMAESLGKRFQVIIGDEAHCVKDPSAQRTKATMPLLLRARRVILLTGTPALNKPKELFQLVAALVPSAKLKMTEFGQRYCQNQGGSYRHQFDKWGGASNLGELNMLLKSTVMIRRLKRDVLTQLPKKRRQQVFLSLDGDARKELKSLSGKLEGVKAALAAAQRQSHVSGGAAGGLGGMEQQQVIMEMYRRSADLKVKAVQEYVSCLLDAGEKFICFAHHAALMDGIEHACRGGGKGGAKGVKFIRIDGKTPPSERQKLVCSFQENDAVRVAILSIKAAGVGLTLTAASTVVFAEMSWTPGEIIQAEDRAHRIGQASSVSVIFLHVKNSIDDIIWQTVERKLENVGEALDGQAQAFEATARDQPEAGQKMVSQYFNSQPQQKAQLPLAPPPGGQQPQRQQQQQQQQCGSGGAQGQPGHHSPAKGQQQSLLAFFPKQQQQRALPPAGCQGQLPAQATGPPGAGHAGPPLHAPSGIANMGGGAAWQQQQQQGQRWGAFLPPEQALGAGSGGAAQEPLAQQPGCGGPGNGGQGSGGSRGSFVAHVGQKRAYTATLEHQQAAQQQQKR